MSTPIAPPGVPADAYAVWVRNLERNIEHEVFRGVSIDDAVEFVRRAQTAEHGAMPEYLANRLAALRDAEALYRERLDGVQYLRRRALRAGRPAWYGGPGTEASNWHGLEQRLRREGRTEEEVRLVDEESTTVLSLLDNPGQPQFSTRGLVIGHVQSGKTGNMAALIAKAADTPYRFFVVLSGMTDSLRNQTQGRLELDVVGTAQGHWHCWTRTNSIDADGALLNGDFSEGAVSGFAFGFQKHLAVMKKNAGVLRRFLRKLRATPTTELGGVPFLIIDDECDQASVNSARLDTAISKINELIRAILQQLPRVAYVGYTATPFANVLINPQDAGDLYPRHFIHPLRRPDAYFGAAELFGRAALEGDGEDIESGHDMIRVVPDAEIPALRPQRGHAFAFRFEVSASLRDAIRYFIMATAAREVRGQTAEHSSFLLHTSVLNSIHRSAEAAVRPYIAALGDALVRCDAMLLSEMREQWEREARQVEAADFGRSSVTFGDIRDRLGQVAQSIEIKVENWSSSDRIDYSQPSRRYLVIGGNVLARGLTLHGLIVSFFMRTSSQYDTLMQMGRWFGYRPGFEDLPRVWMEDAVRQYFYDLATVEEEIRRDAARYAVEQLTPENFAVRIQRIPGLAITAKSKMRHAVVAQIGYAGQHLQTIRFRRRDKDWLEANWRAGALLVGEGAQPERVGPSTVVRNVPVAAITAFLERYKLLDEGRGLVTTYLVDYIARRREADASLDRWNVVVVGALDGQASAQELGRLGHVACVSRSPLRDSGEVACIKALMSRRDLITDIDAAPQDGSWDELKNLRESRSAPPLLLLYPIFRNSEPSSASSKRSREPLKAAHDVLGIGIAFPGKSDENVYVQANLQPEEAEESADRGEDAIPQDIVDDARG